MNTAHGTPGPAPQAPVTGTAPVTAVARQTKDKAAGDAWFDTFEFKFSWR